MPTTVKTRIIKIGNSQGIRIPKLLLEQVHLTENEEVELEIKQDQIIVRPLHEVRYGWESAFKEMAEHDDDKMLDEDVLIVTDWDEEEWEW